VRDFAGGIKCRTLPLWQRQEIRPPQWTCAQVDFADPAVRGRPQCRLFFRAWSFDGRRLVALRM